MDKESQRDMMYYAENFKLRNLWYSSKFFMGILLVIGLLIFLKKERFVMMVH